MKKGDVFLVVLSVMFLINISLLGFIFYTNLIESKSESVGGEASEVLNSITKTESNYFYVEDSARLSWCSALDNLAEDTGVFCFYENYPIWDNNLVLQQPLCDPSKYEENFELYFRSYFDNYLSKNNLYFDYQLEIGPDYFVIKPTNKIINVQFFDQTQITSSLNPILNIKLNTNFEDYNKLINCVGDENCLKNLGATQISKTNDVTTYEFDSITNPCTAKKVKIKFGFAKNIKNIKLSLSTSQIKLFSYRIGTYRELISDIKLLNPGLDNGIISALISESQFNANKQVGDKTGITLLSKDIAESLGITTTISNSELINTKNEEDNEYFENNDERNSIQTSVLATITYLKQQIDKLGSLELALLKYNNPNFNTDECLKGDSYNYENCKDKITQEDKKFISDVISKKDLFSDLEKTSEPLLEGNKVKGKLISWSEINQYWASSKGATIIDVNTGIKFRVQRYGGSKHADVEPLTKEDTQKLIQDIYKSYYPPTRCTQNKQGEFVCNEGNLWTRRAIIVLIDGHEDLGWIAASMHGAPHAGFNIKNNDYPGHHCIHFLHSTTHVSCKTAKGCREDVAHQSMVKKASIKETIIS